MEGYDTSTTHGLDVLDLERVTSRLPDLEEYDSIADFAPWYLCLAPEWAQMPLRGDL